jgi:branched-chain amino acid transport system permease protein
MIWAFVAQGIAVGCGYATIAIGLWLAYNTSKVMPFAQGAVYTLAGYSMYGCWRYCHLGFLPSFAIALAVAALVGAAVELAVLLPLRRKQSTVLVGLLASFGCLIVIQNCIALLAGNEPLSLVGGQVSQGIELFGAMLTRAQLIGVITSVVVAIATFFLLRCTQFGLQIRATIINRDLACVIGIQTDIIILGAGVISSLWIGMAGILNGYETCLLPVMGFQPLLMGIIAMLVGGSRGILGCMVGGIFVGVLQNVTVAFVPLHWRDAIVFSLLVIAILFRSATSTE